MRVLITGATGRVGQEVVKQALARGHEAIALSRSADKLDIQDARLRKVAADVREEDSVIPLLEGVDVVIHTVGIGASKEALINALFCMVSAGQRDISAEWGILRWFLGFFWSARVARPVFRRSSALSPAADVCWRCRG
jgi:putative NADH-flavin reductase